MNQSKEKVLIINFKRSGDLFCMGHLISSIKKEWPNADINLLIYKEFSAAANCLKSIKNIYSIDRQAVLVLANNPLFSKAHSINKFWEEIAPIKAIHWDHVINYSNEWEASYLTSYLSPTSFSGIKISPMGTVSPSNEWARLFNEFISSSTYSPVHFVDLYHRISAVPKGQQELILKTDPTNNQVALQNFSQIRNKYKGGVRDLKLIGIQIKSSSEDKDIPFKTLVETIDLLDKDPNFCPILLIAPIEKERNLVNQLNQNFSNRLLTVEADLLAMSSVLLNLDALITPDTAIKHLGDLTETPILEVSLGKSPMHKQGSIGSNNLILSPIISSKIDKTTEIHGRDLYLSLYTLLSLTMSSPLKLSSNLTLYRVEKDEGGVVYRPIAGEMDINSELTYLGERYFCFSLLQQMQLKTVYEQIVDRFKTDDISKWMSMEKESITLSVKDLLNCLRSLKVAKRDKSQGGKFLEDLSALLDNASSKKICSIPLAMFKGRMESIVADSVEENIRMMEGHLFTLKAELQIITNYLKDLETHLDYKMREKRMDSISGQHI